MAAVSPNHIRDRLWFMRFWICVTFVLALAATAISSPERVRSEIPYHDGTVTIVSDVQERVTRTRYKATGDVVITFQDTVISGDEAEYDEESREGFLTGNVRFSQKEQWLSCSRVEFDFSNQTGVFFDATGYTDREFWITGKTIRKTGPETYKIEDSLVTSCQPESPKWTFSASSATIRLDRTARLRNTTFKLKGIPVFYSPYMIVPLEKKVRSSGFVPFRTGTSTSKGRVISEGYYQTLGKSADVMVYGDYFTLRGLGVGGVFRARPNPSTRFHLEAYGIKDKFENEKARASGVHLVVDGESLLRNDWRAVARANISSNFRFRQVFSDNFRSATVSQEKAIVFLTRNHESVSTNIAFGRDEVFFSRHPLVIRKIPSLEFLSLGTPIGRSPFIMNFRASLDGVSRTDIAIQTQQLVQRLDFQPSLTVRLPEFAGFSLIPTAAVRETYYGAQLAPDEPSGVSNTGLHRRYFDLSVELRTPGLEREFGEMQHRIEPYATYRRIHGIEDFDRIIRFDEEDVIADTNEVEYGIVNRFFSNNKAGEKYEFMSIGLIQKYYFDPTFGGAFKPDQINSFYPLNSVTGLYQTGFLSTVSPLSAIVQASPGRGIHNDLRLDYDTRLGRWRNASFSTVWRQGKISLSGTYFKTMAIEDGALNGNNVQGQVSYGSTARGFFSSVTLRYNLRTSQLLNSRSRANYTWDCCGIAVEFDQFDLGYRSETRFSFSFTLKGIGSFGNIRGQDSIF